MKLAYPFIQARNFTPAKRLSADVIVIHTMEAGEKPGTARAVAAWFAGATAPRASAHFCIDTVDADQAIAIIGGIVHAQTGITIERFDRIDHRLDLSALL